MNRFISPVRAFVATVLMLSGASLALADQLDDIRKSGKLRVAIAVGTPSFAFVDSNMQPAGSDVETATELAKDLGVKLEIVPVTTAARIPTLQAQRADLVISSLSITEERAKVVDFSIPYAAITVIIAAPKDMKISGYADLAGKRVGLVRASTNDPMTTNNAKGAEIMRFEDEATLVTSVVTGQVEVFSTNGPTLAEMNKRSPNKSFEMKFPQLTSGLGITMNKGEPLLREWINSWVRTNLRSGKLNAIFKKYHASDLPPEISKQP